MNVVLGHSGIKSLISFFMIQSQKLENVINTIEKRLAEQGYQLMIQNAPTMDIDGNIGGTVGMEQNVNGYSVTYSGHDVAYIEFGTGIVGSGNYPDTEALTGNGWLYGTKRGWYYLSKRDGSKRFSRGGMLPEKPLYDSFTELERTAYNIINEVLNEKFS